MTFISVTFIITERTVTIPQTESTVIVFMKKISRNLLFPLILVVALFTAGCQSGSKEVPKKSPDTGAKKEIGNFKVKTLKGRETYIQNIFSQSELTVVNLWEPSCDTCEDEMKILGALGREYAGKGIQMLGIISGVTQEDTTDAAAMTERADADYAQVLDSEEVQKAFPDGSYTLPTTIFVDQNGSILGEIHDNDMTVTQWKDEIEKYHSQVCTGNHPADCGVG